MAACARAAAGFDRRRRSLGTVAVVLARSCLTLARGGMHGRDRKKAPAEMPAPFYRRDNVDIDILPDRVKDACAKELLQNPASVRSSKCPTLAYAIPTFVTPRSAVSRRPRSAGPAGDVPPWQHAGAPCDGRAAPAASPHDRGWTVRSSLASAIGRRGRRAGGF